MTVATVSSPAAMAHPADDRDPDGIGLRRGRRWEEEEPPPAPRAPQGINMSTQTLQFLIQLAVLLVTIAGFGFTIKSAVEVLTVKVQGQQEKVDSLEKKIELLRYDQSQMQTKIGIIEAGRWRPTKENEP